jgi:hypothetical protein
MRQVVRSLDQLRFGVGVLRAGRRATFAIALGSLVYLAVIAEQPHRLLIAAIAFAALAEAVAIWGLVDHGRLATSPHMARWMLAWNVSHATVAAVIAALDGGLASPFVTIFFVCAAFGALTLDRRSLLVVMAWIGVCMGAIGVAGGSVEQLLVYIPCIGVIALLSATISGELQSRVRRAEDAELDTVQRLARAVEYRDASTGGHIDRMAAYARVLAERLGLGDHECELLHRAGPLHDVGKIGVPDRILLKPGRLTLEERVVMERHAQAGHDLLSGSENPVLELGAEIALCHHERWDGLGYPRRLAGEEIPLAARIVAVADVFDAVTTDRVYRPAMRFDEAVELIREGRGSQFDPAVVDVFLASLSEIRAAGDPGAQAPEIPAHEHRPVGAEDETGRETGPDRPVLA